MPPGKKIPRNLHENHRSRMWERFRQTGAVGFSSHQLLEMLLFFSIPRRDTNPLAHQLMYRFGSLSEALHARSETLQEVPGVGPSTASLIALLPELEGYYWQKPHYTQPRLKEHKQVLAYLSKLMETATANERYLVLLDGHYYVQNCLLLSETGFSWDDRFFPNIVNAIRLGETTFAILSGYNRDGSPVPNMNDQMSIKRITRLLTAMDVRLLDYVGFNQTQHFSMHRAKML
ncbi:MAG: hypothetical protein LUF28_05280 [Clostridiales bacterium]|nr:hypothetical protein [Clostridiales bacterium]